MRSPGLGLPPHPTGERHGLPEQTTYDARCCDTLTLAPPCSRRARQRTIPADSLAGPTRAVLQAGEERSHRSDGCTRPPGADAPDRRRHLPARRASRDTGDDLRARGTAGHRLPAPDRGADRTRRRCRPAGHHLPRPQGVQAALPRSGTGPAQRPVGCPGRSPRPHRLPAAGADAAVPRRAAANATRPHLRRADALDYGSHLVRRAGGAAAARASAEPASGAPSGRRAGEAGATGRRPRRPLRPQPAAARPHVTSGPAQRRDRHDGRRAARAK